MMPLEVPTCGTVEAGSDDPFDNGLYCGVYIKCEGTNAYSNRRVTSISLVNCNLTGQLPANSFSGVPYLYYLTLGNNNLTGNIPASLADLTYLTYLDLGQNQLTGAIPENLLGNQSSGDVPPPYTPMSVKLSLRNNFLQGVLPNELGRKDCTIIIIFMLQKVLALRNPLTRILSN